jgi:polar amino acid transport system substrate-binding protein
VEWIKTAPDTKIVDLKSGKFDVVATPIFQTVPRAREVAFTRPYVYMGSASGIVKKGDTRFSQFPDANKEGIIVAVRQGYAEEQYARKNLPKATINSMKVEDNSLVVLEVLSGKADLAIADTSQLMAFNREHPNETELVFVNPPPVVVPAGFIVRHGDFPMVSFLNAALDLMELDGVLDELASKYNADAYGVQRTFYPRGKQQ